MTDSPVPAPTPLAAALDLALDRRDEAHLQRIAHSSPATTRDRFATLLRIYDLHCAPLDHVGAAARLQHHPAVAAVKNTCESAWLSDLEALPLPADVTRQLDSGDPLAAMRTLAAKDRLPDMYKWLARSADRDQVIEFLTLEGGPDAGFDDLVAICQVGMSGEAKMELATNYWDEMGDGDVAAVHTTLHDQLVAALGIVAIAIDEQPESALARNAFGGLLACNRWLQPEMIGALGLIELQAGPRCRLVVQALQRCGAPDVTLPFYEVHATVDPRHGKDWLEKVIGPTVRDHPDWAERIVRGAHWRSVLNAAFLDDVAQHLGALSPPIEATAAA